MIVDWSSGEKVIRDETPEDNLTSTPDRASMRLSPRQVRIGLMTSGIITAAEAVAWAVNRTLPAAIDTKVSSLPEPEQSKARITLADFTVAERLDPMVALMATAAVPPLDDAQLDAFFMTYSQV